VSEFDTIEALRADARTRLETIAKVRAQLLVRDKVLETVAGLVEVPIPDALVDREAERRLHDLAHRLEHQGATIPEYLAATQQDQGEFVAGVRAGATDAVRADLALRAVVARERIEATDDELDREVERLAERLEQQPAKVRRDLERRGVLEAIRSDIARGKALQFLVDHATVVDEAGQPVDLTLPDESAADAETPATVGPDAEEHV
jgi:trigger factor